MKRLWCRYIWGGRLMCIACPRPDRPFVHQGLQSRWHFWRHHRDARKPVTLTKGNELAQQVCTAVGVDFNSVHSLTLHWSVGRICSLEIGTYLHAEGEKELIKVMRHYRMVPDKGE